MNRETDFTSGSILGPLMKFTFPIMASLILQALYGAVDLLVVGQFSTAAEMSAVSTGSQILHTITLIITGLAMGMTIIIGQQLGEKKLHEVGYTIGCGILLFAGLCLLLTLITIPLAPALSTLMQAPQAAYASTVQYVRICSCGILFITSYNLLGSIFRGIGDSKTPFVAVLIACVGNILMDLLFVAVLDMGAAGAALATSLAQGISVVLSLFLIKKRGLPFPFSKKQLRFDKKIAAHIFRLGIPCALQDLLVSISFLVLLAIVNSLGEVVSAGVGVAEKLCAFIMLVPSAYMQSMSAFVAQNIGANQPSRAKRGLLYGMATSFVIGIAMFYISFFHGSLLGHIFSSDAQVVSAAAQYLKGYAFDTMLTSFLFCFGGYFNGCGETVFVMIQGIIGAFCVRIPVSYFFSRAAEVNLFHISLATPCSTVVQIILCFAFFFYLEHKRGTKSHKSLIS